jgi:hypothetical protein
MHCINYSTRILLFFFFLLLPEDMSFAWTFAAGRAVMGPRSTRLHLPNAALVSRRLYYSTRNEQSSSNVTLPLALTLVVPTAVDMEEVGALVSTLLLEETTTARGAVILLEGDLGAGKTAFSRGFVRAATDDWELRVTSPTYLLSNTYRAATARNEDLEYVVY